MSRTEHSRVLGAILRGLRIAAGVSTAAVFRDHDRDRIVAADGPLDISRISPDTVTTTPALIAIDGQSSAEGIAFAAGLAVELEDGGRGAIVVADERPLALDDRLAHLLGAFGLEVSRAARDERSALERFRGLIESASDVIAILDAQGTILYESPSIFSVLGYQPEELVGTSTLDMLHPDDQEMAVAALRDCVLLHTRPSIEIRIRHKNGTWRIFHSLGTNLLDNPSIGGIVVNSRDITELRMLEQRLRQADRLTSIGRLAAQVAHEFNNVLMGIQPLAQVIGRRAGANDQLKRYSELILKSVERGRRITHDILRFARPPELTIRSVDAGALLNAAAEMIAPLLPEEVVFEVACDVEDLFVSVDQQQFIQTLVNLAINARDAMASSPERRLSLGVRTGTRSNSGPPRDTEVEFYVRDTGHGIAEEHLKHIFEPLFTTKSAGTGLGLAVAHQVVRRHGGRIVVDSAAGNGAIFRILVPAVAERDEVVTPTALVIRKLSGMRVLLVEDDENVAAGLTAALEMSGISVAIASRGAEAIPAITRFAPSAVVLDVSLPDVDGRTVFDKISMRWPELPVIFSTAQISPGELDQRLRRHKVSFLQKPYSTELLLDKLAALWNPA